MTTHPILVPLSACLAAAAAACARPPAAAPSAAPIERTPDPLTAFGPLEVGAGYESWTKVSARPFVSPTHGNRFVEIYVNDVGLAAYTSDAEFPPGSVIVKESWERDGDRPSAIRGPIFVMEKRAPGFSPEHGDWYYAIHWESPPPKFVKQLGGPIYWRSPSPKVAYCWRCHDDYDREVGLPPRDLRTWE